MKKILFTAAAATAILILAGCPSGTYNVGDFLEVTIDSDAAELNEDGILDFGMVQAEAESETVSITITNIGDEDISVSSITISDSDNYTLGLPELPGVIAPGDTTQYSLTFEPMASGDLDAIVSIAALDSAEPAELEVTGEGNYPPVPRFGMTVSGVGIAAANGFYERNGFKDGGFVRRPLYTFAGTPYNIYVFDESDGDNWGLDNTLTAEYPDYPLYSATGLNDAMVPPPDPADWQISDGGVAPVPAITHQDISGVNPEVGELLTAYYLYFDEDGDPEAAGSAVFQWYRGDSETGPFSAISGATSQTYTTGISDANRYIKVGITLTAESGITAGEEVLSSPTVRINNPG